MVLDGRDVWNGSIFEGASREEEGRGEILKCYCEVVVGGYRSGSM